MHKITSLILLSTGVLLLSGCSGSNPISSTQPQSGVTSPAITEPSSQLEESLPQTETLPQMIYVRDTPMVATGRSAYVTCGTADGTITEVLSREECPCENGQANFDCLGAEFISLADGAAALLTDGDYQLFLADNTVEYNGTYKKKTDLSQDTLKWLNFYYSLEEAERNAISMVPREFYDSVFSTGAAMETERNLSFSYREALTEEEILQTEELAKKYFTVDVPSFEGVDQIYPLDSDASLYENAGLEGEYPPGNIIIYKVLTVKDRRDGNPFRFISIARNTKSDNWKIINSGY